MKKTIILSILVLSGIITISQIDPKPTIPHRPTLIMENFIPELPPPPPIPPAPPAPPLPATQKIPTIKVIVPPPPPPPAPDKQ
jgi:hypothetical protein